MFSRRILFSLVLTSLGCRSTGVIEADIAKAPDVVCVAAVSPSDRETQEAILRLMGQHDINCIVEGSVVYQVVVRERDVARAKALLAGAESIREKLLPLPEERKHGE